MLDLDALTATTISTGMSRAIRQQTLHTLRIKAAQGHTMAGIAETVGEALTLETAPKLAVHGSYLIHRDSIPPTDFGAWHAITSTSHRVS